MAFKRNEISIELMDLILLDMQWKTFLKNMIICYVPRLAFVC